MIELLDKVYHHDQLAREQGLNPQQRLLFHQKESNPVMEQLKSWCEEQFANKLVDPNCGLGKASQYLLKRWRELTRFCQIPGAPLDNNICYAHCRIMPRWHFASIQIAWDL